jgi:hypothetical protein
MSPNIPQLIGTEILGHAASEISAEHGPSQPRIHGRLDARRRTVHWGKVPLFCLWFVANIIRTGLSKDAQ